MRPQDSAASIKNEFERVTAETGKRNNRQPAAKPFSIRLSDEEREWLAREAGKLSLAAHIRRKLLGDAFSSGRSRNQSRKQQRPKASQADLGRALALLGRSELAGSLDAIARAAVMGALPISPELIQELQAACVHVRVIREVLMEALGVSGEPEK